MDNTDRKILEAYENDILGFNEAKGQEVILNYLRNLDQRGTEIELSQIARHPSARGIHFGKLQSAAKALKKQKKIEYDGNSRVKMMKEESDEEPIDIVIDKLKKIIQEAKKKFDLGVGSFGNGLSVYNRAKEVSGDYEKIAHIDRNRKIKWYIKNPPKEVKDFVEKTAKGENSAMSVTQPHMKVFNK